MVFHFGQSIIFFFLNLLKKLNPSYELLSRKKVAHEVLTQEVIYEENKKESLPAEAAYLTLNINGWSNRCRRSLYKYHVITDNRKAIVLSLIDISSCSHIVEFLANELGPILRRASTNINIMPKRRAIDGNNPNTMQKMPELCISKSENQHIIGLHGFSHVIHLTAGKTITR